MNTLTFKITKNDLQRMDCGALNNVIGLLNYACNVRNNATACKQLDYIRAVAMSKGCTI